MLRAMLCVLPVPPPGAGNVQLRELLMSFVSAMRLGFTASWDWIHVFTLRSCLHNADFSHP